MLSAELSATASYLREFEDTGATLSAVEVQDLVATLSRCVLDAAQLERLAVPAEARLQEAALAGNVVPFRPESAA